MYRHSGEAASCTWRRQHLRLGFSLALLALSWALVSPITHARVATAAASAAQQTHSVSYDRYSLKIDGKRVFLWSGSFQYWRLPSPGLWRDVLQKMKAAGFNAVTLYFYWGYHSPRDGVYDFSGVRNVDRLLDIAKQVGLYVIARPGPYIEAETDAGGLPDWLTRMKVTTRTSDPAYTRAYMQWLSHIDRILARHQLTNGTGTVILYQVENELYDASPKERQYMHDIEARARADGITVPFTGNHDGTFADGTGAVDVPGYDAYPQRFDCSHPAHWNAPYDFTLERLQRKTTPLYFPEFQGGSFDPWGGPGYAACRRLTDVDFERVFYESAIADGMTMANFYMTFGGTTWGWMAYPGVYTSYDYGAAINESRQLTNKYYQQKLLGYFVHAVKPLTKTVRLAVSQPTNPSLRLDGRINPDEGTRIYVLRHADATSLSDDSTHIRIDAGDACAANRGYAAGHAQASSGNARCTVRIPQQPGTGIRIDGRDSKMLLTNYRFGHQTLVYSTSELMTDLSSGHHDIAVLYGREGEYGETVLAYPAQPAIKVLAGNVRHRWNARAGRLRLDYKHDGLGRVLITDGGDSLLLLIGSNRTVRHIWKFDTRRGPVLVNGPHLVRTAHIIVGAGQHDAVVSLTGDTDKSTQLEVFGPAGVDGVVWNGHVVDVARTASGSLAGNVPGPMPVSVPSLVQWKFHRGAPGIRPGFNDSAWKAADLKVSNNPHWDGKLPILDADDYGFHHGDIWYRGHFSASGHEKGIVLIAGTGAHGVFTAWLNGHYLGRSSRQMGGDDQQRAYFNFDHSWLNEGKDNVLSVLVANMGHDENDDSNEAFQRPRGLVRATFVGGDDAIAWKLQGNRGGEDPIDEVRGPLNNGGLYGERIGWSLPGYPDSAWRDVRLPHHTTTPGVAWYRTEFELHFPKDQDAPVALRISDNPTRHYRALIFINGWQFGRYINALGPQHVFVLPPGVLNPDGRNTIAIASWSTGHDGGLGRVSLEVLGNHLTPLRVNMVDSPTYDRGKYSKQAH